MTISINTSDYIKTKTVEIDGERFIFSPMTTSKYLAYLDLQETAQNLKGKDAAEVGKAMEKVLDVIYSMFDKPERVKELLDKVPLDRLEEIVKALMENND